MGGDDGGGGGGGRGGAGGRSKSESYAHMIRHHSWLSSNRRKPEGGGLAGGGGAPTGGPGGGGERRRPLEELICSPLPPQAHVICNPWSLYCTRLGKGEVRFTCYGEVRGGQTGLPPHPLNPRLVLTALTSCPSSLPAAAGARGNWRESGPSHA